MFISPDKGEVISLSAKMKCTWEAAKGEVSLQYKSSGIKTGMLFLQHTPKNFSENQT